MALNDCIFVNISSIYPSFTEKVDRNTCTLAAKAGFVCLSFFSKTQIISTKVQSLSAIKPQMSWETRKSCKTFRKIAKKRKKSICHTSSTESTFGVPPRSYPESIWWLQDTNRCVLDWRSCFNGFRPLCAHSPLQGTKKVKFPESGYDTFLPLPGTPWGSRSRALPQNEGLPKGYPSW